MHQGGNKSGARTGKVFVFIYMGALPEWDVGKAKGKEPRGNVELLCGLGHMEQDEGEGERRVFERERGREIPRAIYGMVIEILRTGPAFAKHARTRELLSRGATVPSLLAGPTGREEPSLSLSPFVFLGRNNTKHAR